MIYILYNNIIYILVYIYLSVASQINKSLRTLFIAKFVVQREHLLHRRLRARMFFPCFKETHSTYVINVNLLLMGQFDASSRFLLLFYLKTLKISLRNRRLNLVPRSRQSLRRYFIITTRSRHMLFYF